MRFAELGLFLSPFVLAASWWLLGRQRRWVVWVVLTVVLVFAAATAWFGLTQRLPRGKSYVPARIEDGRIVSGHGA